MPSGPRSVEVVSAGAGKISALSPRRPHGIMGVMRPGGQDRVTDGRRMQFTGQGAFEPACLVRDLSCCEASFGRDEFRPEVTSG